MNYVRTTLYLNSEEELKAAYKFYRKRQPLKCENKTIGYFDRVEEYYRTIDGYVLIVSGYIFEDLSKVFDENNITSHTIEKE